MNLDLTQRSAVVCGSSQGIGLAAAIEIARLGANIILLARNESRLQEALEQLPRNDAQQHSYLVANFTNPSGVQEAIEAWVGQGNVAEILINNTGGPPGGLAIDANVNEFLTAYNAHLVCNHLLVQALLPGMKEKSYGRIINVISTSVKQPIPGLGVSNTTRGAVASWGKTLANELGPDGITVNNVLPGFTDTARLESIFRDMAKKSGSSYEAVLEQMKESVPTKRLAEPAETGAAIAFLASPAASYINGINLPVDGGRTGCL